MPNRKTQPAAAPKIGASRLRAHPKPSDPQHCDWLIDEGGDSSFPASDPSAVTQPRRKPRKPAAGK